MRDATGRELVVRRPPLHGVLPTAHDMGREHRIIAALGPTPVPVPEAIAYCDDPDVIGAPFYVMSYVGGIVLHDDATAIAELDDAARAHSGESLVDALVALHAVDVDAVGLGDLARRDELVGAPAEAVARAVRGVEDARGPCGRPRPRAARRAASRQQTESTVVHGDFRLGNCIVDSRGEIRAVLDWEICTLGDPRADVGYVLATWAEPGDPLRADDHNPTLAPGLHDARRAARPATPSVRAATSARSPTSSPSRSGAWRASSRASWPATCRARGGEGDVDLDYFRRRVESCAQLAEEYARSL